MKPSMRGLWLLLVAAAVAAATVGVVSLRPGEAQQPQPPPPAVRVADDYVTLSGPKRVSVRELPAVAANPEAAPERTVPRRAPELQRAPDARPPSANALGDAAGAAGATGPPDVGTTFDGLDSTDNPFGLTPPDPQIAVGPSHIVEFVNVTGRITDKTGTPSVADFTLASFFGVPAGYSDFDPKIIYDDIADRFFASYVSIDPASADGFLHLAISASSDPTGLWYLYSYTYADAFPDYPGIGVTDDKFTISYNLFDTTFFGFLGEQTLVVQKSDVVAGGAASAVSFPVNASRFTVRPAQNLSAGSDQYLTTFDLFSNGGFLPLLEITVIRITGTPDTFDVVEASATDLPIFSQDIPPASVTPGGGSIDSGDFRLLEAVKRGDSLWSSASAACLPAGDTVVRSCAHLIEVETAGAPSVVQDIMFGAKGQYYSWPSTRTDASSNLYVSFTGTHSGMFASAQVAGRLASDPLGAMTGSCLLKAGEIDHPSGRWGDYLGAAVDPADTSRVWVIGEYAKADGFVRWGTYIGSLSYTAGGACGPKPTPPPPTPTPLGCDTPPWDFNLVKCFPVTSLWHHETAASISGMSGGMLAFNTGCTGPGTTGCTFETFSPVAGRASSPTFGPLTGATLTFKTARSTENSCGSWDRTFVMYSTNSGLTYSPVNLLAGTITPGGQTLAGGGEICGEDLTAQTVTVPLPAGTTNVAFDFDSVDAVFNDFAGQFIDDVDVSGVGGKANDDFADAVTIPGLPYTNSQSTVGMTLEAGEPQPCAGIGGTVWYAFTPSADEMVVVDTEGGGYDTALAVYTGASLGSLSTVGCDDDSGTGLLSRVAFHGQIGVTYHIQAGGYFGSTGNLVLNLNGYPCAGDQDGDTLLNCDELDGIASPKVALGVFVTDPLNDDTDSDSCTDGQELGPNQLLGGLRDPLNLWDYFNPTKDGVNRVDDILLVVSKYFIDYPDPAYSFQTDRTLLGPNDWNLGPPNLQHRVDDILHSVKQYFHDC